MDLTFKDKIETNSKGMDIMIQVLIIEADLDDSIFKQLTIKKLIENPKKAGAIIAICMQRDPIESLPEWEEIAATAMAVQNMWLCCTEMGIGCYWSSPDLITHMGDFLPMNDGEKCLGFFYMGYYEGELPEQTRKPIADKTIWMD